MAKLIAIAVLAAVVCGCGSKEESPQAAAPAPEPTLEPLPEPEVDVEEEYHKPPNPPTGDVGDTITLTGSNIGVRLRVTVTGVQRAGRYLAVKLRLRSTGITVFETEMRSAVVRYSDGTRARPARGARASCSNGMDGIVRLEVGLRMRGCLLFAWPAGTQPRTLRLALEAIPPSAGGLWRLG